MNVEEREILAFCAVAIVGGGTAGLSLATELRHLGVGDVVVIERETEAGGVPRHCGHYPFGLREYGRLMKGPDYARRNVAEAQEAGVRVLTGTAVTGLHPGGVLDLSGNAGSARLSALRVVLCTGVREASRAQRFLGGDRPPGVVATGTLQDMVYLKGLRPFDRPVILGSELVSLSAIMTCRHLGITPLAMIEEEERLIARPLFRPFPALMGVRLHTGVRDLRIHGRDRVEAVSFFDRYGGAVSLETDGVIVSGRFRPEAALISDSHLERDPGTGGPVVDQFGRCSDPSYFAAGNLLRAAETSGWCWREGVDTARRIVADIARYGVQPATNAPLPIQFSHPALRFVVPQGIAPGGSQGAMVQMQLGLERPFSGRLVARSAGKVLWSGRLSGAPVRRVLAPLAPILHARLSAPVDLALE
ncbi:FAD/NAD(P)-binding oxidoreductase [Tabrizicola sp.]|uniref:NAD(P)/FAD-dependent oxidoreductase n=1 Tax=Tabrizicola sp. TaxID=2005166 RepID=UPI0026261A22|nr:FAD/NAD(P)-binding oxidoreductase [Tabrizicola sp.]MDM7933663.1 FAD/NAD(P)-binding oxidoreductase [Tabrizicola sp.]